MARAALESSEAESDKEPPEEPVRSSCTQEPTLAVVGVRLALGIRAGRAAHSEQLSTDILWLAPQALLVPGASDSPSLSL